MTTWSEYITALERYSLDAEIALRRKTVLQVPEEFSDRPNLPIPTEYLERVAACEKRMAAIIEYGEERKMEIAELLYSINYLEKKIPVYKGKIVMTVI